MAKVISLDAAVPKEFLLAQLEIHRRGTEHVKTSTCVTVTMTILFTFTILIRRKNNNLN